MSQLLNPSLVSVETLQEGQTRVDPITREIIGSRAWSSSSISAQVVWTHSEGERFTAGGQSGLDASSVGYLVTYSAKVKSLGLKIGTRITSIAGEPYELFVNRITPIASLGGAPLFSILYFQDKPLRKV
jgi:hypothetical protein